MPKSVLKFQNNEPVELALAFPQGKIVPSNYGADEVMYTLEYPPDHITFLNLGTSQKVNRLDPRRGERLMICKRKGAEKNSPVRWDVWLSPASEKKRAAEEAGIEVQPSGRPAWGGNPPASRAPAVAPGQPVDTSTANSYTCAGVTGCGVDPDSELERQLRASLLEVEERKKAAAVETARIEREKAEAAVRAAAPAPASHVTDSANGTTAWTRTLLARANALTDVFAAALEHANTHGDAVEPEDVRSFVITAFINLSNKGAQ